MPGGHVTEIPGVKPILPPPPEEPPSTLYEKAKRYDIDGSMVAEVYWEEKNLKRIVTYCQKDVLTVAQLLLRFMGQPLIEQKNVVVT